METGVFACWLLHIHELPSNLNRWSAWWRGTAVCHRRYSPAGEWAKERL